MFGVSVAGYGANLSAGVTLYSAAATSAIDHHGSNRWGSVDSRQLHTALLMSNEEPPNNFFSDFLIQIQKLKDR